jgi:hypothetical protein
VSHEDACGDEVGDRDGRRDVQDGVKDIAGQIASVDLYFDDLRMVTDQLRATLVTPPELGAYLGARALN